MNIGDVKTPAQAWRLGEHRILRPTIWSMRTSKRLARLSDEAFLDLCSFSGTTAEFMAKFHDNARLRFFFHPRNQKDFFLNLLTQTQDQDQVLSEANDVLKNTFQTLGSEKINLGEKISWQKDFKSGKEWPLENSKTLDILDLGSASDVKVPWELSRFHQVWWLGKAYWLTLNEEFAEKFRGLTLDWIDNNPPGKGVNWTVAMEAAIRASNWIAGYYLFCESPSLQTDFWISFLKSLYAHGSFIENNLEYSWRNGNHFISDVVGLIFLGVFFRDTDFGKRWLRWGANTLPAEMEKQVYPDGVDYEKSTSYQRLVLELFYTPAILCMRNKVQLPAAFMNRLERMFEFVQHYTRPDGSIPLFGDADDGRLFRFKMNDEINDHRHALSVGAILHERSDLAQAAGNFYQDALWMFGGEGFEKWQRLRGETRQASSKAFPDGGFYVMRDQDVHAMIDAGDIGMKGWGGHGHNDILSFELWAYGEPVIVDSGTYAYTSDVASRQEFRGTRAHNTIMIDGKEIATFVGLWMILSDNTRPHVYAWRTSSREDILDAAHNAYQSLFLPVVVRRKFTLVKGDFRVDITDAVEGIGKHRIESFLHFAPHIELARDDEHSVMAIAKNTRYIVRSSAGEVSVEPSWFSRSYGIRERNSAIRIVADAELPITIHITISRFLDPTQNHRAK